MRKKGQETSMLVGGALGERAVKSHVPVIVFFPAQKVIEEVLKNTSEFSRLLILSNCRAGK